MKQRGENMLPLERQNRIKELVFERINMKISELSKELDVSEMTVHRDLKSLIDEGFVVKTFGGITLAQKYHKRQDVSTTNNCIICHHHITERLSYRLILHHHHVESLCCAHCGLIRQHQLGEEVMQAFCHDFLRHTTISATIAWYVMGTSVDIHCCQPQVLTFERREEAEKFVKGFGGQMLTFAEATRRLMNHMTGSDGSGTRCQNHDTSG